MSERIISETEKKALEFIETNLDSDLASHLKSTRDFALEINLMQALGLDEEKVALAALCHDVARHKSPAEMQNELKIRGIDPDSFGFITPMLLHGPLAAEIARGKFGIDDIEILDAIRWHATGREDMSLLEILVYVSDKVEPRRDFPGVDELRNRVKKNLIQAFPEVVASAIAYVVAELRPLDYNSIAAYNRALCTAGLFDAPVSHRQN